MMRRAEARTMLESADRTGYASPADHRWLCHPVLWLILAVAAALRLYSTFHESLVGDEIFSASVISTLLQGGFKSLVWNAVNPPFYYVLAKPFTIVAGSDPTILRLLSVLFGVATVFLTFLVGARVLGSVQVALFAAVLVALSDLQVLVSHFARAYTLNSMLVMVLVLVLWRAPREIGEKSSWLPVTVVAVAMTHTCYFSWLYVFSTLPGILAFRNRALVQHWARVVRNAIFAFVPWSLIVCYGVWRQGLERVKSGPMGSGRSASLAELAELLGRLNGLPSPDKRWLAASLLAGGVAMAAAVVAVWISRRTSAEPAGSAGGHALLLGVALLPPVLSYLANQPFIGLDVWGFRFLAPSVGPWALLASVGVATIAKKATWLGVFLGATLLVLQAIPTVNGTLHHRFIPFREAAAYYVSHCIPGEPLYTLCPIHCSPISHYLPGGGSPDLLPEDDQLSVRSFWVLFGPDEPGHQRRLDSLVRRGFVLKDQRDYPRTFDNRRVRLARFLDPHQRAGMAGSGGRAETPARAAQVAVTPTLPIWLD